MDNYKIALLVTPKTKAKIEENLLEGKKLKARDNRLVAALDLINEKTCLGWRELLPRWVSE